ncbi:MAG: YbhN family protein [Alphaproteobacteria bacterium]
MSSAASRPGRLKKLLVPAAKAAVSALLLWLMLRNLDWGDVVARLQSISPPSLLGALVLIYFGTSLSAARWWLILSAVDYRLPITLLLRYVFIGFFFNQALPSTVGGDAMRIVLGTRAGLPVDVAFRSVLAERLIGLFVLLLLSLAGLPMMMRYFAMDYHAWVLAGVILGGLVGMVAGMTLIIMSGWLRRYRLGRLVYNVAHDVLAVLMRRHSFILIATISLVGQASGCLAIWAIARGLGATLDPIHTLMVVPTVFILLMVPISIAGWGLRESMLLVGLGIVGVSAGDAVLTSLLYGLVNLFGSLVGGALWLFDTSRRRPLGTQAKPL